MAQFSDIYSSSAYEGDTLDPFYFSFSNETQSSTPDPTGSQGTLDSGSDSGFLTPLPILSIPDILTRVGPGRTKTFVLYSDMSKDEFVAWWLNTEFGKKKKINWSYQHIASCWSQFDQVADGKTGKPGAMCNQCFKVLEHPAYCRSGTSSLNKHISGPTCRKSSSKKPNIKQLLAKAGHNALSEPKVFTQEVWERKLLRLLAISRLPFQFIEHPEFHEVISLSRLAPIHPVIPSAKTIRSRLRDFVKEQQQGLPQKLPQDAKLSLAIDCWTSPF
ncbi:conserved hypothetical protein [Talaromyces stipitatus ATCC 10500]|uniref:BED-type domain-containing protein n=1 Tax=Talaromyces stipitatus (strain ATCC 10500 / CBS 375.48 / QM 6759 / NRRL 1006) TaxID=441959 RepID=B8MNU1_TALSN|nr:uncharacterized protein TSTA_103990 [Talaromyces stipitatus ATCC 10500]EED14180.1 conserved hypothetical protein [Talaromyces stipitatus ATCC 10500]